jgi:hypothetical protein
VAERYVPFLNWTSHLSIAYFENMDLPTWTLDHPYQNPFTGLPTSDNYDHTERPFRKRDFPWVELETSLQWRFFRRSVKMLKERDNTVFVLVGPFNEHMLEGKSINTYREMKSEIEAWLQRNDVPYHVPAVLPSKLYRDASHPLSVGYSMLAKQLFQNESFRSSIHN